ncbi:hypothetical protein AC249_AIPGENE8439 [Exaiptasia diaphana]|nr:hypothetical protein AC249_AIPGENE8439 [Exaiptasia diaphana]
MVHGNVETKEGIVVVNKHTTNKDKKFKVFHVPVMQNSQGVPFEITAKEDGESYLTGPAMRILDKNNKYDENHPFIFFPLLNAYHSQG